MGDSDDGAYDPSAPYDGAPRHLNGEESYSAAFATESRIG